MFERFICQEKEKTTRLGDVRRHLTFYKRPAVRAKFEEPYAGKSYR